MLKKNNCVILAVMIYTNFVYASGSSSNLNLKDLQNSQDDQSAISKIKIDSNEIVSKPKASRLTPELSFISSQFVGTQAQSPKTITKMAVGAQTEILEQANRTLETGFLFKRVGSSQTLSALQSNQSLSVETQLDYLSIPVAYKIYSDRPQFNAFFAKAGFSPNILVNQISSVTQNSLSQKIPVAQSMSLDAFIGLGVKMNLAQNLAGVIEASYWRGITPVYTGTDIYNSSFMTSLGLSLEL